MFHDLQNLAGSAVMERATLLLNHVIGSEAVATERLRPHAGSCIRLHFNGWPAVLPALPALAFRVTPAGLLEWCGSEPPADAQMHIHVDASNPAGMVLKTLAGERPAITVTGDAALASDVNWLFDNLRWDLADDLEQLVGPGLAQFLVKLGREIHAAATSAARALAGRAQAAGGRPVP
jgi:ubiquinone biosynthesis accessory factor UbiJ